MRNIPSMKCACALAAAQTGGYKARGNGRIPQGVWVSLLQRRCAVHSDYGINFTQAWRSLVNVSSLSCNVTYMYTYVILLHMHASGACRLHSVASEATSSITPGYIIASAVTLQAISRGKEANLQRNGILYNSRSDGGAVLQCSGQTHTPDDTPSCKCNYR